MGVDQEIEILTQKLENLRLEVHIVEDAMLRTFAGLATQVSKLLEYKPPPKWHKELQSVRTGLETRISRLASQAVDYEEFRKSQRGPIERATRIKRLEDQVAELVKAAKLAEVRTLTAVVTVDEPEGEASHERS